MGDKTGISWCDATWNCIRGCSRVSAGCQHCYAEVQAARIVRMGKGKPTAYDGLVRLGGQTMVGKSRDRWTGEVRLVPEMLAWPLRKRKPLRIFVNSMSDLFHEGLTNEQIAAVFGVMAACPQHTFQCLTKRAKRMREWFEWAAKQEPDALNACVGIAESSIVDPVGKLTAKVVGSYGHVPWPLLNVWLGVSVENQEHAAQRIPILQTTSAAVRFVSYEPALGPIDWRRFLSISPNIHWVIFGDESGRGRRDAELEWARKTRDACIEHGVAFHFKQWCGAEVPGVTGERDRRRKIHLPILDGARHAAFPEVSR